MLSHRHVKNCEKINYQNRQNEDFFFQSINAKKKIKIILKTVLSFIFRNSIPELKI